MSRNVPLTTSEKIKLALAIVFAVAIMFPLLRFGIKEGYRAIVRDTEGYEKAMEQCADYYDFKVVVYRSGVNWYNLEVDASLWRSYDQAQLTAYCQKCQESIYKVQQKYKMQEKENQPFIYFYVNGQIRADASNTNVTIY